MVGPPPENLEPGLCERLSPKPDQLEEDISQYLLLHHDYAAKAPSEAPTPRKTSHTRNRTQKIRSKLKKIRPKVASQVSTVVPLQDTSNQEVLYGMYDDKTQCITIIVNDDNSPLNEVITEVHPTSDISVVDPTSEVMDVSEFLTIPSSECVKSPVSPSIRSDASDCGYESLDSPNSYAREVDVDIWDESVSELFPSLI